jgi:DNA-binding MarR family transcriptional regulator
MRMKCQEAKATKDKQQGKRNDLLANNVSKLRSTGNDTTYTLRRLARDNPEAKQEDIAKKFGVSQPYVSQVISKNCEVKEKVIVPDWIKSSRDQADFRKLPAELREKVAAVSLSIHPKA